MYVLDLSTKNYQGGITVAHKSIRKKDKEKNSKKSLRNPDYCIKLSIESYLFAFLLLFIGFLFSPIPFLSSVFFWAGLAFIFIGAMLSGKGNANYKFYGLYTEEELPTKEEVEEILKMLEQNKKEREIKNQKIIDGYLKESK